MKQPWLEFDLGSEKAFNTIVITENSSNVSAYSIEYYSGGKWYPLLNGSQRERIKVNRFDRVWGSKIRFNMKDFRKAPEIAEFGVYNERR